MQKTSIFVSSTYYDLRYLRELLRSAIESLGHEPVMSEYSSFPVEPQLDAIENCKKVVRERADLLVLIVGGRRGSLDTVTQRSVVNVEYREAKRKGIDCFVFVDRQVLDLVPHYKKNPNADFSGTVDNQGVFVLVEELIADTKWIFPFQKGEELVEVLKLQLSIRFQDLLRRARQGRITIPTAFQGESQRIIDVLVNKGPLWEYELTYELLEDRIGKIDAKFLQITNGTAYKPMRHLNAKETVTHMRNLFSNLESILSSAEKVLSGVITPGFGFPGVPGDAFQIKRGCDSLYELLLALYESELDVRFVRPHELFVNLFERIRGWSVHVLSHFHKLPRELKAIISRPDPEGSFSINLVIGRPPSFADFEAELERLTRDPRVTAALRK